MPPTSRSALAFFLLAALVFASGCDRMLATTEEARGRRAAHEAIERGELYFVSARESVRLRARGIVGYPDVHSGCFFVTELPWYYREVGDEVRAYQVDDLIPEGALEPYRDENGEIDWARSSYEVLPNLVAMRPLNLEEYEVAELRCTNQSYAVAVAPAPAKSTSAYVRSFDEIMLAHPRLLELEPPPAR